MNKKNPEQISSDSFLTTKFWQGNSEGLRKNVSIN
jgi:hypothetical protein